MACSCKNNKALKVQYTTPHQKTALAQNPVVKVSMEVRQTSDSYSFGATTRPNQLCLNCVGKHLGLAQSFLQEPFPDSLLAVGQLMCAAQHLRGMYPKSAYYFQDLAYKVLDKPYYAQTGELIKYSAQRLMQGQLPQLQQPSIPGSPLLMLLSRLLQVYCMLFTELLYEDVNRLWTMGALAKVSLDYQRATKDRDVYVRSRKIWKMVQQMKTGDSTYYTARGELWDFIKDVYQLHLGKDTP